MNCHSGNWRRWLCTLVLIALAAFLTTAEPEVNVDYCLACHGPFDDLVASTSTYTWPSGDRLSPHRYVPHASKLIADCTFCHNPHSLPPSDEEVAIMKKVSPNYCFECHHTKTTFACGTCHPVPQEG